jgi:succinyl-diaminopimelate desuccinylase
MKELLINLINTDTTARAGELPAAEIIRQHLQSRNIDCELTCWDDTRANIVAHIKSAGKRPALLFACHLDVVPPGEGAWKHPPFSAVEKDGKIFGRGATDMKGSIAAVVTAVEELIREGVELQGDLIFAAVAGEETNSCGIKKFTADYKNKLLEIAGVIVAEPTDFEVIVAHRGLLWLELITKGKTSHGSMPHLGVNAISSMRALLDEIEKLNLTTEKHNTLGKCSMSINTIDGGKAENVVPDLCSAKIDIRTLPNQSHAEIVRQFQQVIESLKQANPDFDAEVKIARDVEAMETDSGCDFVKEFCSTVGCEKTTTAGFCTDGPFLTDLNSPIVIFGPGKSDLCHKPDEYIEIADLQKAVTHFKNIIHKFLC